MTVDERYILDVAKPTLEAQALGEAPTLRMQTPSPDRLCGL